MTRLPPVCWHCGLCAAYSAGFCRECISRGKDSMWLNCTGCGDARKRRWRGEQTFTCTYCRLLDPNEQETLI